MLVTERTQVWVTLFTGNQPISFFFRFGHPHMNKVMKHLKGSGDGKTGQPHENQ